MSESVSVVAPLWRWTAKNGVSWFFVTIDGEEGEKLSATEAMRRLELGGQRGFRSLKVEARIGIARECLALGREIFEGGACLLAYRFAA